MTNHQSAAETNLTIIASLQRLTSDQQVITGEAALKYHTDERNRYHSAPIAVVFADSVDQVSNVVRWCTTQTPPIAVIAQGGNTGLVGGCAVLSDTPSILLNLSRLNAVRKLDVKNRTLTIEAGATLESVHQLVKPHGLIFPLTLASQSAATIGGNLSTNAGGTQVLRYGNMRELCLGLEVVLPDGQVWSGLNTLRKNNTGYDLKDLFIGAEGTLGIVTAAVLKLYPEPQEQITALIACPQLSDILQAFDGLQRSFDAQLTAFEYISPNALALVCEQFDYPPPFAAHAHTAMIELSINSDAPALHQAIKDCFETVLNQMIEQGHIQDALIAQNATQRQQFWQYRENISAAQKRVGKNIKHDISLPISAIDDFTQAVQADLEAAYAGIEPTVFGHIGDGNLHFNISRGTAFADADQLMAAEKPINDIVYRQVMAFEGSISAEHGIGLLKRDLMPTIKSEVELKLMHQIKQTLDPHNQVNPHKVLK